MRTSKQTGVTLIEVMVVVAILAIALALAVPNFQEQRERLRLKSLGENLSSFISNARSESIKRNARVRVNFIDAGEDWCIGMRAANDPIADPVTCDCNIADPADGTACAVDNALRAHNRAELENVPFSRRGLFNGDTFFTIEPVRGTLTDLTARGFMIFSSPSTDYEIAVVVNGLGKPQVCVPDGATFIAGIDPCPGDVL